MKVNINKLTEQQKDAIEELTTYRFNHRITTRNIYDWLQNFEDSEVDEALTILSHVDYYTEEDIINSLRKAIAPYVRKKLHFVAVGEAGKSGHSMVYVVQSIMKWYRPKKYYYHSSIDELKGVTLKTNELVFLVDDIIGTGKTFNDYVKDHPVLSSLLNTCNQDQVILLPVVITDKGKERIGRKYPKMKLLGEEKRMAFSHAGSCFGSHYKMLPYRNLAYRYGKRLTGKKSEALGYDNSQQLIVFSHSIPNNSLPIFWSEAKGWKPLVPRFALQRGQRALHDRNESNRWLVFFKDFFNVTDDQLEDLFQDKTKYSLILVLRMKMRNVAEANIANKLGLHFAEMEAIWDEGVKVNLWNDKHQVTDECKARYKELMKKAEFLHTDYRHLESQSIADAKQLYVPETFRSLK